ncbi:MAG: GNAT family N-acetyltransferase, partial [Gammaproteobacteria bacterium]|nr:GNAT family N-acetyltransferase [Gammaproteobacteria bacterium]
WHEPWTIESALHRLSHFFQSPGFVGLLAEDTATIAFVLGNTEPFQSGEWFYLREMCTSTAHQRQGIGRTLLRNLDEKLGSMGIRHIYLLTDRHIPAAQFYLANGYQASDRMGCYFRDIPPLP